MSKSPDSAKLLNLPDGQQAELAEWLLGGMPYYQARILVWEKFGVDVKSNSTFSGFWAAVCQPHLLRRRSQLLVTSDARAEAADKEPGSWDKATLDAIKQKAYQLAESPNSDPKDVKAVLMLVLKSRDQDLQAKSLALERDKFETLVCEKLLDAVKLDQAREISASDLSNADKIAALRQAYFSDVDALQQSGEVKIP